MSILDKLPKLEEERKMIEQARLSRDAMGKLLERYKVLVHVNAHKWKRWTTMDVHDLYQEGFLGLMRAAQRFDTSYETKFTSWAICCIEGAIRSSLRTERKHARNVSLATLLNEDNELEGLVTEGLSEIQTEESLTTASQRMKLDRLMTKREMDLIRTRYNLKV